MIIVNGNIEERAREFMTSIVKHRLYENDIEYNSDIVESIVNEYMNNNDVVMTVNDNTDYINEHPEEDLGIMHTFCFDNDAVNKVVDLVIKAA